MIKIGTGKIFHQYYRDATMPPVFVCLFFTEQVEYVCLTSRTHTYLYKELKVAFRQQCI